MLLSRKFVAMLGGTLEMDLTFLQLPLKNGMIGCLLNMPITGDHVQDITHPFNNDKAQDEMIKALQKYSPEDIPFAMEEDFDQIKWPKKE
jgi:hypothetical protein